MYSPTWGTSTLNGSKIRELSLLRVLPIFLRLPLHIYGRVVNIVPKGILMASETATPQPPNNRTIKPPPGLQASNYRLPGPLPPRAIISDQSGDLWRRGRIGAKALVGSFGAVSWTPEMRKRLVGVSPSSCKYHPHGILFKSICLF